MTSSSITVQWGAVDCIHRNGDITGYSLWYEAQGISEGNINFEMASGDSSGGLYGEQGSGSTQIVSISGGGATMRLISGLTASTNYSIEVAAMNNMGTGPYSNIIFQLTEGM